MQIKDMSNWFGVKNKEFPFMIENIRQFNGSRRIAVTYGNPDIRGDIKPPFLLIYISKSAKSLKNHVSTHLITKEL